MQHVDVVDLAFASSKVVSSISHPDSYHLLLKYMEACRIKGLRSTPNTVLFAPTLSPEFTNGRKWLTWPRYNQATFTGHTLYALLVIILTYLI